MKFNSFHLYLCGRIWRTLGVLFKGLRFAQSYLTMTERLRHIVKDDILMREKSGWMAGEHKILKDGTQTDIDGTTTSKGF